jgi:DNA-binding response OmpR family regulator
MIKVLVVDDESVTRRIVTHTLKTLEIEVVGAEDGTQALALADEHPLALAIVDINLPDMDGFTVVRRLKEMPQMENVPIVMFTARNHPGDEATALELGATGFLYKPFSTQELRDIVRNQLGMA